MATKSTDTEPEILNPGGKNSRGATSYKARYTSYKTEAKGSSAFVFLLSLAAFFLSLVPIVGLVLSIAAMIAARIKNSSMVLAIIAFIIGSISTSIFLLIALVIGWLF